MPSIHHTACFSCDPSVNFDHGRAETKHALLPASKSRLRNSVPAGRDNSSGTKLWNCTGGWLPRLLNTRTWKNITLCPTCKVCAQTNKLEFGDTCKSVWSPWSFYPSVSSHVHTFQSSIRCNSKLPDFRHLVKTCSGAASSHEFPSLETIAGFPVEQYAIYTCPYLECYFNII